MKNINAATVADVGFKIVLHLFGPRRPAIDVVARLDHHVIIGKMPAKMWLVLPLFRGAAVAIFQSSIQ